MKTEHLIYQFHWKGKIDDDWEIGASGEERKSFCSQMEQALIIMLSCTGLYHAFRKTKLRKIHIAALC